MEFVMNAPMLHKLARPGSEKERIWRIADELLAKNGVVPSGRDVVDLYVREGGNEGTGFTQYSHWKRELETRNEGTVMGEAASSVPGTVPQRPLAVADDGRLLIPADMRAAMLLDSGGRVTVSVEDGVLKVISPLSAIRRLQKKARTLVAPGTLVSDELIADRRREAASE
jgi:hypothetical protein